MSSVSIILRTAEYRGDHTADISRAYSLENNETVHELVERLLKVADDWIELRLIKDAVPVCDCDRSRLDPSDTCPIHGFGDLRNA